MSITSSQSPRTVQIQREYISYNRRLRKPANIYIGEAKTTNVFWQFSLKTAKIVDVFFSIRIQDVVVQLRPRSQWSKPSKEPIPVV